ncbi:HAD family hydrolase [Micrococcus sp.]|uniref:HAD family hydrolase n=1 Tax=Micrococcus sp. TaxID=1271 RepID=UPI002A91D6A0|nr:HAD family hydrolase [Micrococcus sp.]MDY6055679.1 HAD family hydrolase [Micrococcus sp.]
MTHHPGTPSAPRVEGVLFDLDDTLLDLRTAQLAAFTATVRRQWPQAPDVGSRRFDDAAHHFAADVAGHYQRYVAGETDFTGQRLARARDALTQLGAPEALAVPRPELWTDAYEAEVRSHWALFEDVAPTLEALRRRGVAVGIITNNVEAYQRGKADTIGLTDVRVLVGSDTAGAPKPDPAPFLEACRRLDLAPAQVACVGDSLTHDVRGAAAAGLVPVWLRRGLPDAGRPVWEPEAAAWQVAGLGALTAWWDADLASREEMG